MREEVLGMGQQQVRRIFNKKRVTGWLGSFFCYVVLIGIIFLILFPFLEKISNAFKSEADLLDKTVMYIPKEPTLDTLKTTLEAMQYGASLLNTVILSTSIGLIQTFVCTFIAYGFARYDFAGKRLLFAFVFITLLVPPQVIMTSLYMIFHDFDILGVCQLITGHPMGNLLETSAPLYLLALTGVGFKNALYIFMMRQFFRNMPNELEEAGQIDGAGTFRIFFRIFLPSAVPMMVTIFLFAFSWQWSDGYYTTMLMRDAEVLSNSLSMLQTYGRATLSPVLRTAIIDTGLMLVILPLLLVYLVGQRFFVEGVSRSGIVG